MLTRAHLLRLPRHLLQGLWIVEYGLYAIYTAPPVVVALGCWVIAGAELALAAWVITQATWFFTMRAIESKAARSK